MESIVDTIFSARRIAFVGVAKNSGKTTAMNFVLRHGHERNLKLAVVSIGLDGERADALLGTPKPPVGVFAGQVVISSESSLASSSATFENQTELGFNTPLGETVMATVKDGGDVVLSGLRHRDDLKAVLKHLDDCDHVLIDGAYGRVMSAHADTCDGVVVSTGAVVGTHAAMVAEKTSGLVERLTLPEATGWRRELILEAISRDRSLLGGPEIEPIELPTRSALVGLPKVRKRWNRGTHGAAVLGALSDRVAQELMWRRKTGFVVAESSTSVQLDDTRMRQLKKGWEVEVLHATKVLAISVNPTSPQGHRIRSDLLAQAISINTPKTPVFDAYSDVE